MHPESLKDYPNWVAQYKFNGTRNIIYVFPDGHIELFNRHGEHNKAYQVTEDMIQGFKKLNLKKGVFYVFDGELMHSKTKGLKDRVILFDVLVNAGEYLLETSYIERYKLLMNLVGNPSEFEEETGNKIAYRINKNVWLAKTYTKELTERFKKLAHMDEVEGLMLKNPNGKLSFGTREQNNGEWLVRVRKPSKNYSF